MHRVLFKSTGTFQWVGRIPIVLEKPSVAAVLCGDYSIFYLLLHFPAVSGKSKLWLSKHFFLIISAGHTFYSSLLFSLCDTALYVQYVDFIRLFSFHTTDRVNLTSTASSCRTFWGHFLCPPASHWPAFSHMMEPDEHWGVHVSLGDVSAGADTLDPSLRRVDCGVFTSQQSLLN